MSEVAEAEAEAQAEAEGRATEVVAGASFDASGGEAPSGCGVEEDGAPTAALMVLTLAADLGGRGITPIPQVSHDSTIPPLGDPPITSPPRHRRQTGWSCKRSRYAANGIEHWR